jgi:1,4-alpha-glucan branching enzyme
LAKPSKKSRSILDAAIDAVIHADHDDPFGFLGLHNEAGGLVLRTMQPGAAAVGVIDAASGETVARLPRLHPDGLFGGPIARQERFAYRLRIEDADGTVRLCDDPYRFPPILGELDLHLLGEGTHLHLYRRLGAHVTRLEEALGVAFAVWAPNAKGVSVIGDFNRWDGRMHPMRRRHGSGVWEIFIPDVAAGALYKYEIKDAAGRLLPAKADPYGFAAEVPPKNASKVWNLENFAWTDASWLARRQDAVARDAAVSIYEVHLGGARRATTTAR